MTPEQALMILDQVASQVSATRETHFQIQVAIDVLSKLVEQSILQAIPANEELTK